MQKFMAAALKYGIACLGVLAVLTLAIGVCFLLYPQVVIKILGTIAAIICIAVAVWLLFALVLLVCNRNQVN